MGGLKNIEAMFEKLLLFSVLYYYWIKAFFLVKIFNIFRNKKTKKTVLILENFPIENTGYQYRAKKWAELLNKNGFHCEVLTLIEEKSEFDKAIKGKNLSRFFIYSIRKRFKQCLYARNFETVIVRRELLLFNDYGNLFMEKFLLKIHLNVILDFDDDIAAAKNNPRKITSLYGKLLLEDGNKFNNSLRLYRRFIVASDYLKQRVLEENPTLPPENICVIPTCVDYDHYPPKQYPLKLDKITFGWIGGDHNYPMLDRLIPILNRLSEKYSFRLIVIGGKEYKRPVTFELEFLPWSLESEVENLYKIDVGLMPLTDSLKSRGKGGFKLLQYMGLGIVSVASAITINKQIVDDGLNSLLVYDWDEWEYKLTLILKNQINLQQMGSMARLKISKFYTFDANREKYLSFISTIKQQ
ncbi:MAG: glycosyltransferase family 4 protein [Bacteroidales bacterium]